jgi:aromatic ring-opening dioxygenase catalytic subunit (LigB family)
MAPFAAENHPTDKHLLPLLVAMGVADPMRAQRNCTQVMNTAYWRWTPMPSHERRI